MTAAKLIATARDRGVELYVQGAELRYRARRGALDPDLRAALRAHKAELVAVLRGGLDGAGADLLDQFLGDASIPAAVFHSKPLGRDFVLARDPAALAALTEADRTLPVLFFSDAEHVGALGLEGLRVLLDLRSRFGPEVALREVRVARVDQ